MLSVGLIGLGTVGTGVYQRLEENRLQLEQLLQQKIEITKILVSHKDKQRETNVEASIITDNGCEFLAEDFQLVFEAMGGSTQAKQYVSALLKRGIPVITANKELMAKYGKELEELANINDTYIGYEAAVAGGIPIINTLKANLSTTTITSITGILNGTTNYILTEMNEKGRGFEEVLKEAQELGYAEADPTNDVEGFDSWYKIRILSRLCFGEWPNDLSFFRSGITNIEDWKVAIGEELGLSIKLIAEAKKIDGKVIGGVAPAFVTADHTFAQVKGVTNAVQIEGPWISNLSFNGPGAGKEPTANSMVEDFLYHHQRKSTIDVQKLAWPRVDELRDKRMILFPRIEEGDTIKEKLSSICHHIDLEVTKGDKLILVISLSEKDVQDFKEIFHDSYEIFGQLELESKINQGIVAV